MGISSLLSFHYTFNFISHVNDVASFKPTTYLPVVLSQHAYHLLQMRPATLSLKLKKEMRHCEKINSNDLSFNVFNYE